MVKIKYSKLLKYSFLIILYTTIFFLLSLNFPKYISADSEKENNESKTNTEYSLLETKTDGEQDTKDKDIKSEDDKEDKDKDIKSEDDTKDKDKDIKSEDDTKDKDKEDNKKNKKPNSKIEYSLLEENIVAFDGSQSSDEDGTIVSYGWDFGDGGTGSGVTVTHTYNEPGNYQVTLTVTDDDGTQDTCDKEIVIKKNKKPDSKIEYSLLEENIVAFDGSSSSDEDGTIVSYDWDFGDGSTGSGSSVMHIYNEPGNYKVTLTVTDDDGAYKKDVANIKLKNKDNDTENISESNEFTQSKDEEKKGDFKNLNNDLSKLNEKLVKSEEKSIPIFNHLLQKLLNSKEDKIIEILNINVNSIGDLLNIEKIIKNYKIIAVIGFDEIIDLNYEKDIKQNKENILTEKYPEFILNFWNNFKEFAALFN